MKKLNLGLFILYIGFAFYMAYEIDINENHKFMASTCVLLTLMGSFRFHDYLDKVKEEKNEVQ